MQGLGWQRPTFPLSRASKCSPGVLQHMVAHACRKHPASRDIGSLRGLCVAQNKQGTACTPPLKTKAAGTSSTSTQLAGNKSQGTEEAKDAVLRFYAAYNAHDLDAIAATLDDQVTYHDMIYAEPFVGKAEVMAFMSKVCSTLPPDLKFVVDDITSGDPNKVGLMWHVEIGEGTQVPFSRGCSFYTVNDKGKIIQARDLVEGAVKPGDSALKGLAAVAPLLRRLGPAADPSNLKKLPLAAAALWAFYVGYTGYVMLGTSAPGLPAWQTSPEVLQEVVHESLNFFYVNIGLNAAGITLIPDVPEHPVSEALFNFVGAWGLMFLPVMLTERESAKVGNKVAWWAGIMLLTNVFFIPFLALRAAPNPSPAPSPTQQQEQHPYAPWAPAMAAIGAAVGVFSIYWALEGRPGPEVGGWAERYHFLLHSISTSRVWFAFAVDAALYAVWQAAMLSTVPTATPFHKFVPFFGLAAHLLQTPRDRQQARGSK